jgi:hypothetical protein
VAIEPVGDEHEDQQRNVDQLQPGRRLIGDGDDDEQQQQAAEGDEICHRDRRYPAPSA